MSKQTGTFITSKYAGGEKKKQETFKNGKLHSEANSPAYVEFNRDGSIKMEAFYKNGSHCSDGKPAIIKYHSNGNRKVEEYCNNKQLNRLDGPAYIEYFENGKIKLEEYRVKGVLTRDDGPAILKYKEDLLDNIKKGLSPVLNPLMNTFGVGTSSRNINQDSVKYYLFNVQYYKNGKKHRDPSDGPADITYKNNGDIKSEKYYKNGNLVDY